MQADFVLTRTTMPYRHRALAATLQKLPEFPLMRARQPTIMRDRYVHDYPLIM
jgi:hypothetical protein